MSVPWGESWSDSVHGDDRPYANLWLRQRRGPPKMLLAVSNSSDPGVSDLLGYLTFKRSHGDHY